MIEELKRRGYQPKNVYTHEDLSFVQCHGGEVFVGRGREILTKFSIFDWKQMTSSIKESYRMNKSCEKRDVLE